MHNPKEPRRMTVVVPLWNFRPGHFDGTLKQVLSEVETLIAEYGADAVLSYDRDHWESSYDDHPSPTYFLTKHRPENDEELAARQEREAERAAKQQQAELETLEALRKKYNV